MPCLRALHHDQRVAIEDRTRDTRFQIPDANHSTTQIPDKKACKDDIVYKSKYIGIENTYCNFKRIYTDGSKDGKSADGDVITFRLQDNASICSAELNSFALDHIESEG